ncbi:MAG: recombinase family protein, partial [Clostridia bacterium]|nr:recombinase family protein [Clostridia bacterium]
MKLTKRILVAVLSLVMLLTIVGAAFAEEYEAFDNYPHPRVKTDGSLTIGYISDKPELESIQRILQQLRLECKHRGWNLIELYYENEQDLRDKFLNLINQDVDAILTFSLTNMDSKQDIVAQARNAGIGFYNTDTQVVDGVISNSA